MTQEQRFEKMQELLGVKFIPDPYLQAAADARELWMDAINRMCYEGQDERYTEGWCAALEALFPGCNK